MTGQTSGPSATQNITSVERLFVSGKDAYVITSRGKLWRWRKNRWTSLINEVDGRPDKNRKWLSDGSSLFLGAETTAWFLGNTPKAIPLDWRNRFPLEGVKNFLRLPDGKFFVLGQRGKYFCGEINPIRPPSRAEQLDVRFGCSLDASGRIWCVEGRDKNTLKKWNGNGWSRHPFPGGFAEEQFRNLLADEQGRVWLFPGAAEGPVIFFDSTAEKWQTFANPEEAFEFLPPPPRVQVTVTAENDDACLARFDSSSPSDLTIRWQLDESPWQQASGKKILLGDLPNGRHVLRAQALSNDLLFSPTATAEFEIRIDSEKQLAALIARLGDPDFAKRETAVRALLRQPEAALPALRAARDGAPASQRWWIDATIQQMGNGSK